MSNPLVSIVLAAYNGERYIRQQLDSIIEQSYKPIEILVIDDCSTDNTPAILKEFATHNENVKVVKNETNLGYVKNFEKGMLLAKGDYIAPCDQDDVWNPEKISILMRERSEYPIIYCNSELIDEDGNFMDKKLSDIKRLDDFNDPLNYTIGGSAPGHAMIVRKSVVLAATPLPLFVPHDYWIAFVATFSGPLKFLDTPLVFYRQHGTNVFGAIKVTGKKRSEKSKEDNYLAARERIKLLYEKCPATMQQKDVFYQLYKSYQSFSLENNWKRMVVFFKYRKQILAFKRRSTFRQWLFCLKMFFIIK